MGAAPSIPHAEHGAAADFSEAAAAVRRGQAAINTAEAWLEHWEGFAATLEDIGRTGVEWGETSLLQSSHQNTQILHTLRTIHLQTTTIPVLSRAFPAALSSHIGAITSIHESQALQLSIIRKSLKRSRNHKRRKIGIDQGTAFDSHEKKQLQTWIADGEKLKGEKCVRSSDELARRWGKCLGKVGKVFGDMQKCVGGEGVDVPGDDDIDGREGEGDESSELLPLSSRPGDSGLGQDVFSAKRSIKNRVDIVARWRDAVGRCIEEWKHVEQCEEQHVSRLVEWWGKAWSTCTHLGGSTATSATPSYLRIFQTWQSTISSLHEDPHPQTGPHTTVTTNLTHLHTFLTHCHTRTTMLLTLTRAVLTAGKNAARSARKLSRMQKSRKTRRKWWFMRFWRWFRRTSRPHVNDRIEPEGESQSESHITSSPLAAHRKMKLSKRLHELDAARFKLKKAVQEDTEIWETEFLEVLREVWGGCAVSIQEMEARMKKVVREVGGGRPVSARERRRAQIGTSETQETGQSGEEHRLAEGAFVGDAGPSVHVPPSYESIHTPTATGSDHKTPSAPAPPPDPALQRATRIPPPPIVTAISINPKRSRATSAPSSANTLSPDNGIPNRIPSPTPIVTRPTYGRARLVAPLPVPTSPVRHITNDVCATASTSRSLTASLDALLSGLERMTSTAALAAPETSPKN
ncbi:hypothetical protein HK097_003334, partial [Rhizophlyctis rosea]